MPFRNDTQKNIKEMLKVSGKRPGKHYPKGDSSLHVMLKENSQKTYVVLHA